MKTSVILLGCGVMAILSLGARSARAQTASDSQLWLELGVRYEPARRLRLSLDQQLRADESMSRPRALMSELGLRYSPLRWLRLAGGYRLAYERDNAGQIRRRHRLHADVSTRHRLGAVGLGFRLRFQEEARAVEDDGAPWRHTLRIRAEGELRRLPLDPYLAVEVFLRLGDGSVALAMRKVRGTVGIDIDTAAGSLGLGYRIEGDPTDASVLHILLLEWHFDVDL